MIDFQLHRPGSLSEAFDLLRAYGEDARVIAGGTALVLQMKQRLAQPEHLIMLRGIPGLNIIEASPASNGASASLRVGALTTHRQVENAPLVKERIPVVAEIFRQVATPRIRNMATVGGGLVNGDPNQDPPPGLIALGASATLTSASGQRTVPLEEFFIDYYETDVQPGEILTSVEIPPVPAGAGAAYLKFLPRTKDDYATVSVAAIITPGPGNICQEARLALGSVNPTPVRATQTEAMLRGQPLTEENIRAAAAAVKDAVDPLDDFRGSAGYKREMAEVFVRRAIQQALANAGRSGA